MADVDFLPTGVMKQLLRHCINMTLSTIGVEVQEPTPLDIPIPYDAPICENGALQVEVLFDVTRPLCKVICQSVFKASGWVQRKLSPCEYLRVFDMPLHLDEHLASNKHQRGLIAHGVSPLVVSAILQALWEVGGRVELCLAGVISPCGMERGMDKVELPQC
jgi:hypothetical protein